jgi:uncharacterized membrane protein YvbJ
MSPQPSTSTESITSSWTCPECGFDNKEGSKFCGQCGASLIRYCPQCGGEIPSGASSCEHCGANSDPILVSGERCQHCGLQNDAQTELCEHCGARLLIECPECGTMTRARTFCSNCGFDYSRFVTQKVIERFGRKEEEKRSVYAKGLNAGIMVALVTISIVIIIYILHQM